MLYQRLPPHLSFCGRSDRLSRRTRPPLQCGQRPSSRPRPPQSSRPVIGQPQPGRLSYYTWRTRACWSLSSRNSTIPTGWHCTTRQPSFDVLWSEMSRSRKSSSSTTSATRATAPGVKSGAPSPSVSRSPGVPFPLPAGVLSDVALQLPCPGPARLSSLRSILRGGPCRPSAGDCRQRSGRRAACIRGSVPQLLPRHRQSHDVRAPETRAEWYCYPQSQLRLRSQTTAEADDKGNLRWNTFKSPRTWQPGLLSGFRLMLTELSTFSRPCRSPPLLCRQPWQRVAQRRVHPQVRDR
jgi:hypothetical protein